MKGGKFSIVIYFLAEIIGACIVNDGFSRDFGDFPGGQDSGTAVMCSKLFFLLKVNSVYLQRIKMSYVLD